MLFAIAALLFSRIDIFGFNCNNLYLVVLFWYDWILRKIH
jgi:hypothetical protein